MEEQMTLDVTRNVLLWCTVLDYGILLVWFLAFVFAHEAMLRIHGRWFTYPATSSTPFTMRG